MSDVSDDDDQAGRVRYHIARASGCAVTVRAGATTETEAAAELHRVTECAECPACAIEPRVDGDPEYWCHLADEGTDGGTPPGWCPLRRGPVVMRLGGR